MRALEQQTFTTPRGHPAPMWLREGTNDYNTLNACMTEDEYHLRDLTLSGLAIDVGSFLGGVAIGLALDNPDLRVIAVEPVPDNVSLILRNIEANRLQERVILVAEGAAGPHVTETEIRWGYIGEDHLSHHYGVGNTTLAYEYGGDQEHESKVVACRSLAYLAGMGGAESIDFLKIDCEGCEWSFLDDPLVSNIREIRGEWHPVQGKTIADMSSLLGGTHVLTFDGPQAGPGGFRAVRR